MQMSFYTAGDDLNTLRKLLDILDSFAVLTSLGNDRFVAQPDLSRLDDGYHQLWIRATGSLMIKTLDGAFVEVDPLVPWRGGCLAGDSSKPMTDPFTFSRIVQLRIKHNTSDFFNPSKGSGFAWLGSRYAMIGSPATVIEKLAWQNLRKTMQNSTAKITLETEIKMSAKATKIIKTPAFFFPCAAAQFHASPAVSDRSEKG